MPEKPNENIQEAISDTTKKTEKKSDADLEISPSPELEKISKSINAVQNAVSHDQSVKLSQLQQIQEAIKKTTVKIGGEEIPVEEMEKIPDLEKNVKIWEEIRQGNFINLDKLTYATSEIIELLSHTYKILYKNSENKYENYIGTNERKLNKRHNQKTRSRIWRWLGNLSFSRIK